MPESLPERRVIAPAFRGTAFVESGAWKVAYDEYYWDRLEAAHALVEDLGVGGDALGVGFYRTLDAEWLTRLRARKRELVPWLTFEWIAEEIDFDQSLEQFLLEVCREAGRRLNWAHSAPVLVTALAEEVDAPWTDGRAGYMVDKYPYDKICIPRVAFESRERLREVLLHEYAHVINLNVTQGRIPRWLDEGIAMVIDGGAVPRGVPDWHSPEALDGAYQAEQSSPVRHGAYAQSLQLAKYLVQVGGEGSFENLLKAFSNNSTWTDVKMAVTGQTAADEALREVYGFGTSELFERVRNVR
jgi:hypothetical protein